MCAYAQPTAGGLQLTEETLIAHCKTLLPMMAVPSRCMILESLPLGAAGKLLRDALPAPDWSAPLAGEGLMCKAWPRPFT